MLPKRKSSSGTVPSHFDHNTFISFSFQTDFWPRNWFDSHTNFVDTVVGYNSDVYDNH